MEFAGDVNASHPRRFPDPQLPPHGNNDLVAQRRQELLWELHKERIRQDILLRELAETERAMAARFAPAGHWPLQALPPSLDYRHQRWPPSLPPWEATPRPLPAMTEHPPCPYGSPAAARPPPMYPHVARSPSPVHRPRPADGGEKQHEAESSGATERPMLRGDLEGCPSLSKRTTPEGALVPAAANAGTGTMLSALFAKEVTPVERVGVDEEPKHDVQDGHVVQLLHESGKQSSEQRIAESTVKDQKDELVARLCYSPAGQENGTSDEKKQTGFRGPFYGSGEPSSEQNTVDSTVKDQIDELVSQLCQYRMAGQEKGTSDEQKQIGFREPTPQAEETPSGVKRKLTATGSPVTEKKPKLFGEWTCHLCQVSTTGPRNLVEHWAGKMHTSKLQAMNKTSEAMPGSPSSRRNGDTSVAEKGGGRREPSRREKRHGGGANSARPAEEDEDREPAPSRWTCRICDAKCTSASTLQEHLGGRRHRENTEAILAKHRGCYSRKDAEQGKNTYRCNVCDAHCNGDTMLASHLVGRRHRETLEGRD